MLVHVNFFEERMKSPGQILEIKLIIEDLDKGECEEFEMALQHKSKLHVCKDLKWMVGFEDPFYIDFYVPFRYLWTCWVGMLIVMGPRNVLIVGHVQSLLSMFFRVHHNSQEQNFFDCPHEVSSYSGSIWSF